MIDTRWHENRISATFALGAVRFNVFNVGTQSMEQLT